MKFPKTFGGLFHGLKIKVGFGYTTVLFLTLGVNYIIKIIAWLHKGEFKFHKILGLQDLRINDLQNQSILMFLSSQMQREK